MFERFSDDALQAVVVAQEVARLAGARTINTRHLLGALASRDGPAPRALVAAGVDLDALIGRLWAEFRAIELDSVALASVGIDLEAVRERTDAVFGAGALDRAGPTPGHIPLSRDTKKAMRRALRQNVRLGRTVIDGAGLVLGILRARGPAVRDLNEAGADLAALRLTLERDSTPGAEPA